MRDVVNRFTNLVPEYSRLPKTAVTLKDVAHQAKLSVAAVSRFLNRSLILPEETAARVRAAVENLGYQPNAHARRLSRGKADTIGLIVPDIANPFFALLADAVEREAEAHGVDLLLCATRNRPVRELHELARLSRTLVDGLLFVTNHGDDGTLAAAIAAAGHVVLLDEDVAGVVAPKVFADNYGGGALAARCLLEAGHRRLAFLGGPPGLQSTAERHAGFRDAIRAAGPAAEITFESFGEYSAAEGRTATERMLAMPDRPTAAFATSDETALGLLDAARRQGIGVPDALSVIAFDDAGPLALLGPPITAVRQPVAAFGSSGVRALLDRLAGAPIPPEPARLPVMLIERASVATPALRRRRRRALAPLGDT